MSSEKVKKLCDLLLGIKELIHTPVFGEEHDMLTPAYASANGEATHFLKIYKRLVWVMYCSQSIQQAWKKQLLYLFFTRLKLFFTLIVMTCLRPLAAYFKVIF